VRRLPPRREDERPARDVPERRLHLARQPRRPPRGERSVRSHEVEGLARRPPAHDAPAPGGAPLRARLGVGGDLAGAPSRPAAPVVSTSRIAPLDASLFATWTALFDAAHSACFCRYWHFAGTKNDWLARCATGGAENRAEQEAAVARHEASMSGLVAID